jgi:hypothetical protein
MTAAAIGDAASRLRSIFVHSSLLSSLTIVDLFFPLRVPWVEVGNSSLHDRNSSILADPTRCDFFTAFFYSLWNHRFDVRFVCPSVRGMKIVQVVWWVLCRVR